MPPAIASERLSAPFFQDRVVLEKSFPEDRPRRRTRPRLHRARPAPRRRQPRMTPGQLLLWAGAGLVLAGALGAMAGERGRRRQTTAVRLAASGAGLLAASVLVDSAMEHHRGNFSNRAMYIAPVASGVTMAAAIATATSRGNSGLRGTVFAGAMVVGLVGTGFHLKNIMERPGGLSFNNLFYRAPFGAPGALFMAGAMGLGALAAERKGDLSIGRERAGRGLAATTAGGLLGLTAEVGLLHFRGAFHNPLMYAPVLAAPATAVSLGAVAGGSGESGRTLARIMLAVTTALGLIGTGLHAYGVGRNMGGFANWTQNLFQGPPIAAPPSLAGLALGGFAALRLLDPRGRRR